MFKMKKILLTAAVAASLTAYAEVLTPAQALMRVEQSSEFLGNPTVRRMAARNTSTAMPLQTISSAAGVPQLYLFADGDNGLMILSAESEAEALVGYTDSYAPNQPIPPAMEYMLGCYAAEIDALRDGMVTYSANETFNLDSPEISPICTTKWDQGAPYNAMCPLLGGQRSVTGCVATAMAQVLKTYEYPKQCKGGNFSYSWEMNNNSNLSMNFDEVTLDWDEMADKYSSGESAPAVAELMKALGYASKMEYSPYASGTHGSDMAAGLVRNFDYDCTLSYELRSWYPLGEWLQKVYDVIAGGHPLYYDGANPDNSAAHAFVVDGYKGDGLFHLNWGWGGMSDGYFRLTALDPAAQGIGGSTAGYDREQGAMFNLIPGATTNSANAPLVFFMVTGFRTSQISGKVNSNIAFYAPGGGGIYNNGPVKVDRACLGVKFTKSTGETYYFHNSSTLSNIAPYSGVVCDFSCYVSNVITNGSYTVSPAVYNPTTAEYFDVRVPVGKGGTISADVTDGKIIFTNSSNATLTAEELVIPETIHQNTAFELSAKLTNPGKDDYYGPVVVKLYKTGTSTVAATLGNMVVSAGPGESVDIAAYFRLNGTSTPVGQYEVAMTDQNGSYISEHILVTVEAAVPKGIPACKSLRAVNKKQDELTFRLSLSCTGGKYVDPVYIMLTEYGKKDFIAQFASPVVTLDPDVGLTTLEFTCNFADGVPGARYTAYPYYIYDSVTNTVAQMQGSSISFYLEESSAIEDIDADAAAAPVEYFDLEGRRVIEPKNGVYIRKQGSEVSKVVL